MSLLIRNLAFALLQPGIVAGLVPYLIAREDFKSLFRDPLSAGSFTGLVLFMLGVIITVHCITGFARDGRGTLSPADPTQKLVITGMYRYSRNPMYIGVTMILAGEVICTMNVQLFFYAVLVVVAFNLFVIFWEEPRLSKDFGEEYQSYQRKVRRWI